MSRSRGLRTEWSDEYPIPKIDPKTQPTNKQQINKVPYTLLQIKVRFRKAVTNEKHRGVDNQMHGVIAPAYSYLRMKKESCVQLQGSFLFTKKWIFQKTKRRT